jgi:hypothetical protein
VNILDYTPDLVAGHVNEGTALDRSTLDTVVDGPRQLRMPKLHTECDARVPATSLGGLSLLFALWRKLGASADIDQHVEVLKQHRPYHESDHIAAQVASMVAGGTCIEDQAMLQQDPAVLRMMGSTRFPDPTTSGDFLRRFDEDENAGALDALRATGDRIQERAWQQLARRKRRRAKVGDWALVDLDSHIAAFTARQKEGADFSYLGKWAYHPLLVTLANTSEILAVRNRPGNVQSPEGVEELLDLHLPRVGREFGQTLVRGDSAFDTASIRASCVRNSAFFAVVGPARSKWVAHAQAIPEADWSPWHSPSREREARRRKSASYRPRRKGRDWRGLRAQMRLYTTLRKQAQWVAELSLPPTADEPPCRVVILREEVHETHNLAQRPLFKHIEYRFFLTNLRPEVPAGDVVALTYDRCDQENIIEQLKNDLPMWRMPVREAHGNAAWVEIARLAWNMGKWLALIALPQNTVRWEWKRFRRAFIQVAAEVVLRSRQTVVRFNPGHRYVTQIRQAHARLAT